MVIPNQEVKMIYRRTIRQWFDESVKKISRENLLNAVLSEDVGTLNQIVGTWLEETISFYDEKENYYHGFMVGLLYYFLINNDYIVKSNREAGSGRYDVMIERVDRTLGIVLEFKYSDSEEELESDAIKAIEQIKDKEYYKELILDKIENIDKYVMIFKGKKCIVR